MCVRACVRVYVSARVCMCMCMHVLSVGVCVSLHVCVSVSVCRMFYVEESESLIKITYHGFHDCTSCSLEHVITINY